MNKRWMMAGAVSLAMTTFCATGVRAEDKETDKKDESEVKMSFKEVPSEVRATLKREAFGEKITTVDKEKKDGKTVYEADVEIDGTNYEIVVGKNGKLISKTIDKEEEEKTSVKEDKDEKKPKAKAKVKSEEDDDDKKMKKSTKSEKENHDDDEKPTKKSEKKSKDKDDDDK